MKQNSYVETPIGIDIGNTECRAAFVINKENGKDVQIIRVRMSLDTDNDGNLFPGIEGETISRNIFNFKRLLGREDDYFTEKIVKELPFHFYVGPNRVPSVEFSFGPKRDKKRLYLEEVLASVLGEIRCAAEVTLERPISVAVITVPAYFGDSQRQAVLNSGRLAGFSALQLLYDTTAMVVANVSLWCHPHTEAPDSASSKTIMTIDIGSSTTSIGLYEVTRRCARMLGCCGSPKLGSAEIDRKLSIFCSTNFLKEHRMPPEVVTCDAWWRLQHECENAKIALSDSQSQFTIRVANFIDEKSIACTITRETLVSIYGELMIGIKHLLDKLLETCGKSTEDVDDILMGGGAAKAPCLRQLVCGYFQSSSKLHFQDCASLESNAAGALHTAQSTLCASQGEHSPLFHIPVDVEECAASGIRVKVCAEAHPIVVHEISRFARLPVTCSFPVKKFDGNLFIVMVDIDGMECKEEFRFYLSPVLLFRDTRPSSTQAAPTREVFLPDITAHLCVTRDGVVEVFTQSSNGEQLFFTGDKLCLKANATIPNLHLEYGQFSGVSVVDADELAFSPRGESDMGERHDDNPTSEDTEEVKHPRDAGKVNMEEERTSVLEEGSRASLAPPSQTAPCSYEGLECDEKSCCSTSSTRECETHASFSSCTPPNARSTREHSSLHCSATSVESRTRGEECTATPNENVTPISPLRSTPLTTNMEFCDSETGQLVIGMDWGTEVRVEVLCQRNNRNAGAEWNAEDAVPLLRTSVPAYVAWDESMSVLTGAPARDHLLCDPTSVVFDFKRFIGRSYHSPLVQNGRRKWWPFSLEEDPNTGKLVICVYAPGTSAAAGSRKYYPEEVLGLLLQRVRQSITEKLNGSSESVLHAIISVPVCFGDSQRQAVRNAVVLAGFNFLGLVHKPTAVGWWAYRHHFRASNTTPALQRIAVLNNGASTTECTVFKVTGSNPILTTLSSSGCPNLGGEDVDLRLALHWLPRLRGEVEPSSHDADPLHPGDMLKLRQACECVKKTLSRQTTALLELENFNSSPRVTVEVTRGDVEECCHSLFERAVQTVGDALELVKDDSVTNNKPLDLLLFTGGASHTPKLLSIARKKYQTEDTKVKALHELTVETSAEEELLRGDDLEGQVVPRGAALLGCAMVASCIRDDGGMPRSPLLLEILSRDVSLLFRCGSSSVCRPWQSLPASTPLPFSRQATLCAVPTPSVMNVVCHERRPCTHGGLSPIVFQTQFSINISRELGDVSGKNAEHQDISITFHVDTSGIFSVCATCATTGTILKVTHDKQCMPEDVLQETLSAPGEGEANTCNHNL